MSTNKPPRHAFVDRPRRRQTRPYAVHANNPASSKLLRQFYRAKFGSRDTLQVAIEWFQKVVG